MINIKHRLNRLAIIFLMVLSIFILAAVFNTEKAEAIPVSTIPSNSTIVPSAYQFTLGHQNATWQINPGYANELVVHDYRSNSGSPRIELSVKKPTAPKTFTNPATVYYTNAGKINGRAVNVELKVNSLTLSSKSNANFSNASVANCDGAFLTIWGWGTTDVASYPTTGSRYKITHTLDITFTITYADTGKVVDLPCFQAVNDLDTFQNVSTIAEGFIPSSGYTRGYIYPGTYLVQHSGGFFAPAQKPVSGNESYVKGGLYAATGNGSFRGRYYATNCRTGLMIYNQYKEGVLSKPVLHIDDSRIYEPGDEVVLDVKQKIGTFFVDTITAYTDFSIKDDIPKGLTYKSAKVLDSAGNDVTGKGTLSYDEASRTVNFTFGSAFTSSQASYNGAEYTLRILTTADHLEKGSLTIEDTGQSVISGIDEKTNEKSIKVAVPYHVNYKYVSGNEGRKLPDFISTEKGDYAVSDNGIYYKGDTVTRKETPSDGTKKELFDSEGNLVGTWILSWDAAEQTVNESDITFTGTWRYVPAPRLVIVKKIKNDSDGFTEAHGEQSFMFKITGKDSGKSWYKSITFSGSALEAVNKDGYFAGPEGTQFTLKDGYIYGTCDSVYLPEDDYIVEEIDSLRFDETLAEVRYHGENTKVISSKAGSAEVPLKLSSYKPGDAGFDAVYSSVCFTNEKAGWDRFSHTDIIINKLKGGA